MRQQTRLTRHRGERMLKKIRGSRVQVPHKVVTVTVGKPLTLIAAHTQRSSQVLGARGNKALSCCGKGYAMLAKRFVPRTFLRWGVSKEEQAHA